MHTHNPTCTCISQTQKGKIKVLQNIKRKKKILDSISSNKQTTQKRKNKTK